MQQCIDYCVMIILLCFTQPLVTATVVPTLIIVPTESCKCIYLNTLKYVMLFVVIRCISLIQLASHYGITKMVHVHQLCVFMCACVCVCVCVCVLCMCICMRMYRMYVCTCMCACILVYVYVHKCACVCALYLSGHVLLKWLRSRWNFWWPYNHP